VDAVLTTRKGHTSKVNCVAFSPDGGRIVSGGQDGTLRVWDASKKRPKPAVEK
jgi:WD40 repeat protein